ncbi:MAG TPA: LamG domain-containing protein [Candidatus Dormibacteraeota bacterium]|nr:LamG domain-containing protein [Candidatus Dormibacteraeota bacterium]
MYRRHSPKPPGPSLMDRFRPPTKHTYLSQPTNNAEPANSPNLTQRTKDDLPRWAIITALILATLALGSGAFALYLGASSGPSSSNQASSINLGKGLVGYWKLNGNTKDSTPYSNNGTNSGTTATTDREGTTNGAMSFNGSSYIKTGPLPASFPTGSLPRTYTAWIYDNGTVSSWGNIFAQGQGNCTSVMFGLGIQSGSLTFWGGCNDFVSTLSIPQNQWCFVAVTYDGTNVNLWVNGQTQSHVEGTLATAASNLFIGGETIDNGSTFRAYFSGSISDLHAYNRPLSVAEVTALYNQYDSKSNTANGESGLVGWWKMQGNTKDSSPYGNNGTNNGATLTTDRKGAANSAYSFNGSSTYIDVPNSTSLNISTAITLSAWVNPVSCSTNYPGVLAKGYATSGGYGLNIRNNCTLWFELDESNSTRHFYNPTGYLVPTNTWTLLTATYDGSTMRIYANNTQIGSGLSGAFTIGIISNDVLIGRSPGWGTLSGSVSDVRIYNRALSASQIAAQYNSYNSQIELGGSGTSGNISLGKGIVGHWPLAGNAKDATPYSNNGTVNGATLTTDRKGLSNGAYSFNGTSNSISTTIPGGVINSVHTVSLWVYIRGAVSGNQYLFDTGGGNNNNIQVYNSHIRTITTTNYILDSNLIPVTNTWYNIVQVFDGATLYLYINGALDKSTSATAANPATSAILGEYGGGGPYYLNGNMSGVRVYNRALSAAEITALYNEYQ